MPVTEYECAEEFEEMSIACPSCRGSVSTAEAKVFNGRTSILLSSRPARRGREGERGRGADIL